jgi:hypothetical protein
MISEFVFTVLLSSTAPQADHLPQLRLTADAIAQPIGAAAAGVKNDIKVADESPKETRRFGR